MVDAGRVWNAATALERIERFEAYDISWLEEPLAPYDIGGYQELSLASPIPIAAGEIMTLAEEYKNLIENGGIHVVQPAPCPTPMAQASSSPLRLSGRRPAPIL